MKSYPLYDGTQHTLLPLEEGNAGLHFTRFYSEYNARQLTDDTDKSNTDHKTNFLKRFAKTLGDTDELKRHQQRQLSLITAQNGKSRIYTLNSCHLVTGMGNEHIVENGFLWHYTLGVPYLSGSQLKGLLRSTIEQYLDINADEKARLLHQWFGSADKFSQNPTLANQCGELIFFDALPITPPTLTVDIMTPHMGNWYAEGGKTNSIEDSNALPIEDSNALPIEDSNAVPIEDSNALPADWHDPTPIPFLAVQNARFLISLGKRAGSNIDLDQVWTLLDSALTELGVGAKTYTGYGYLQYKEKDTIEYLDDFHQTQAKQQAKAERAQALASASPFHAELLQASQAENWEKADDSGKTAFTKALTEIWLPRLQEHPEEKDSITYMLNLAHQHYPTQMKNPNHKKVKPHQREWMLLLLNLAGQKP